MSRVVALLDFAPPERLDGLPFTEAVIEESASATGTWTVIDTITLSPPDVDPKHPVARDLSTPNATIAGGFYRVTWKGQTFSSQPTSPLHDLPEDGIRPTLADVGAILRARTKVKGGRELGTFTGETRPTDDEVARLIDDAVDEVMGKVQPADAGSAYERRIRGAVAMYTAILIENSYFPEQVTAGRSPATAYQTLYEKRVRALIAEGETGGPQGEGSGGSGGSDSPADAYWTFPVNAGGMIGNGTVW